MIICSVVYNLKTPEKVSNIMNLSAMDIEMIEKQYGEIISFYKDGNTVVDSFLPPKKFKPTSNSTWCTKHLHGISLSSGYKIYTKREKVLKNLANSEKKLITKGYEKCRILSGILETKVKNKE